MTEEERKLKIIAEILKTICEIKEIKKKKSITAPLPDVPLAISNT